MLYICEWTSIDYNGSMLTSTESFFFKLVGLHKMLVFIVIAYSSVFSSEEPNFSNACLALQSFRNAFGVNSHHVSPPP